MKKCYLLLMIVAVLCLASGAVGQTVQGVVTGTVTDPSGASVPKAKVTLTNAGTNISQHNDRNRRQLPLPAGSPGYIHAGHSGRQFCGSSRKRRRCPGKPDCPIRREA